MQTLQRELDWEREMLNRGVLRYKAIQDKAVQGDRPAETSAGSRLLYSYIQQVSDHIRAYLDGKLETRRAPNARVLMSMDTDKIAFMSIKRMLTCVFTPDTLLAGVAVSIGKRIEDEYNFMRLEAEHKQYHDSIMRALEERHTANYDYMRKSILHSYKNAKNVSIDYWTEQQRAAIGLIVVQLVRQSTDLFDVVVSARANARSKFNATTKLLRPTDTCLAWVKEHDEAMALLLPDRMPMLIEPAPWVAPDNGGYFLPELRSVTPLVIMDKHNKRKRLKMYRAAVMPKVLAAVNRIQATPWRINERVLDTMQDIWSKNLGTGMPPSAPYEFPACPLGAGVDASKLEGKDKEDFDLWKEETRFLHIKEAERKALCMMVSRNLRLANEMRAHNEFYYVWRADFRCRLYAATTGLSPQGADQGKGLLQFAEARPLGARGLYWLKVHGANKWGEDKCSYDARVAWIDARRDEWLAVDADPVGTRAIWGAADKPYQFLAFCFEYAAASRAGESYRSRMPVALDGSCNGLQHFSAMLRDHVGGSAVNLTPAEKPSDIYQQVADVATQKLMVMASVPDETAVGARNWLRLFRKLGTEPRMPRKLAKPPVMTLPYGSSQRTCTDTTHDWYMKYGDEYFGKNMGFRHSVYITPVIWSSIGEVVVAARQAMGWLQTCAGLLAQEGHPINYVTPLGFPIHQRVNVRVEKIVKTTIDGTIKIRILEETDQLDGRGQRRGVSPNTVHGMDATHLMMVVNAAAEVGINSFAMIHDDFGCHADRIDEFHAIIRRTFVDLYTKTDVLGSFREQHMQQFGIDLPEPPPPGVLDLNAVLDSKFFFG